MIRVFILLILVVLPYTAISAAMPAVAVYNGRINQAVGGVINNKVNKQGFAANDPRFGATFTQVSNVVGIAVGGAATAALGVAGTPVWATILAGAAIGLGIDYVTTGIYDWAFNDPSSASPITTDLSDHPISNLSSLANPPTTSFAPKDEPAWSPMPLVDPFNLPGYPNPANTAVWKPNYSLLGVPPDVYNPAFSGNNLDPSIFRFLAVPYSPPTAAGSLIYSDTIANMRLQYGYFIAVKAIQALLLTSPQGCTAYGTCWDGVTNRVAAQIYVRVLPNVQNCANASTGWTCGYTYATHIQFTDGTYAPESFISSTFNAQTNPHFRDKLPVANPQVAANLNDAVGKWSDDDLNAALDTRALVALANKLWADAAALPNYDGIPYSASDPITQADVLDYVQTYPNGYPTNTDLLTLPAPSGGPAVIPSTMPTPFPSDSPGTSPSASLDLGPDPDIPEPELEETPTAAAILAPIFGLMPDLLHFVVPSQVGVCPQPSAEIFGKTLVMTAHCDLIEPIRPTMYPLMAALWAMLGVIIILRA